MFCLPRFYPGKILVLVELLPFACVKGVKIKYEVFLPRNKVYGKITGYDFYQTKSKYEDIILDFKLTNTTGVRWVSVLFAVIIFIVQSTMKL